MSVHKKQDDILNIRDRFLKGKKEEDEETYRTSR